MITVGAYLKGYDPDVAGLQLRQVIPWVPDLGGLVGGADGLDAADPAHQLHHNVDRLAAVSFKPRLFYFPLLAMDGGQIAVFAVQDMLLFFLAWELELIPVYLLLLFGAQTPIRHQIHPPTAGSCSSCWWPWPWPSAGGL